MAGKAEQRRKDLRTRLIDIAQTHIAADGVASIKARSLAAEAHCAVGAIYNAFDDLQDIVIAVNGRTFQALGAHMAQANARDDPAEQLVDMSLAYLEYASSEPNLWRAMFEVQVTADMDLPTEYLGDLEALFSMIRVPVSACFPDFDSARVDLVTRALFSSVHGIVLLGLENRISGVPHDQMADMIALMVRSATR